MQTLPDTHPLRKHQGIALRRFMSPMQRIATKWKHINTDRMETIQAYTMAPWESRIAIVCIEDRGKAAEAAEAAQGLRIATSASARHGIVGVGIAIRDTEGETPQEDIAKYAVTLGPRTEQNPYIAELEAMAMAFKRLPWTNNRLIFLQTSNRGALQALHRPRQQSGQASIREIYEAVWREIARGNHVLGAWAPAQDFQQGRIAKKKARKATKQGKRAAKPFPQAKTTTLDRAKKEIPVRREIPLGVGRYSKEIDTALPGGHTKTLYDRLNRAEASILARLRTGMIGLNGYLHQIGMAESELCDCGAAKETVQHFLFRCTRWRDQRNILMQQTETRRGDLSFFLGGKAASDPEKWQPNMEAVRATIQYVMATGRFAMDSEQAPEVPPLQTQPANPLTC